MNEYSSVKNGRSEATEIKAVTKGTIQKKSGVTKFLREILSENIDNMGSYIIYNIIAPNVGNMFKNIGISAINAIFKGNAINTDTNSGDRSRYWTTLNTMSRSSSVTKDPRTVSNVYKLYAIDIDTEEEANAVLNEMYEYLQTRNVIRVAEYYQLNSVAPKPIDWEWGWKELKGVEPYIIFRDGQPKWRLPLGKPVHIK